jgi:proton glutamate symport protein
VTAAPRAAFAPALSVLVGLALGLALGLAASKSGSPALLAVARAVEPLGTIFVNAIRMTVVPLVVAMLITGIVSISDGGLLTRLGLRSLVLGLGLTTSVAAFTMVIAAPLFSRMRIDPAVAESLRQSALSGAAAPASSPPGLAQWLTDLIPVNPIKAAADGTLLPLLVFTILLGFALTRVSTGQRAPVVGFFAGLGAAMMVLVGWIIRLAPLGVFALAAPLAARMGSGVAGALLSYVLISALLTLAALALIVYPVTILLGRVSLRELVRGLAPAQALAFSSRSTMATLPAMIESARRLGVPESVVGFVVPLAASLLRVGAAVGQTVAVLFAARLFDVTLSPSQLVTVLLTTVVTSFAIPGIPGGSIVVMVPILASAGVPAAAVGILLGADVIPDMFRTMANVTGGISAGIVVGRAGGKA